MPSFEKNASVVAEGGADLDRSQVREFWALVRRCLSEVFHMPPDDAEIAIAELDKRMDSLSKDAVLLMYHNSPLQVAANLAGAGSRKLTAAEELAYDQILNAGRSDRP